MLVVYLGVVNNVPSETLSDVLETAFDRTNDLTDERAMLEVAQELVRLLSVLPTYGYTYPSAQEWADLAYDRQAFYSLVLGPDGRPGG